MAVDTSLATMLKQLREINSALSITSNNIKILQTSLETGVPASSFKEIKEVLVQLRSEESAYLSQMGKIGNEYQNRAKMLDSYRSSLAALKLEMREAARDYKETESRLSPYRVNSPILQDTRRGPVSNIPHPSGTDEILDKFLREQEEKVARQKAEFLKEFNKKARTSFTGVGVTGVDAIRQAYEKNPTTPTTNALKAEEEKLLAALKNRVATEVRYTQALRQAENLGFDINNLKGVQQSGPGGIEKLSFQKTDDSGVDQRFDTMVSPSGRSTPTISNQFRTFGQGVIRDIGELSKWSIALAAVYGPLRKLQELIATMIENQSKLAEAAVSVNSSFLDQSKIFDTAADVANRAGEEVTGVIDAFTQSYRAAGGSSNEIERFNTATKLLNDSLILSKLSTLDQSSAIDTLSAALRQSAGAFEDPNRALENGTVLLDKWVRVTKVANVDLATLATGFAVVGDSADAAGLSLDELNGLIAAIAETGIASGKESANIAKRIVGLFQSDQAEKALNDLGIASKTAEREMRPLLDIITDIYNLRQQGVISDTQFSELTRDIGQGPRGQASVTTLLENADRIFEVAKESEKASGDAQDALTKQLDTIQTSLTRLGNAFEELAQTMGVDGGFLELIQFGVDKLTGLVNIIDDLVALLGKATPALITFGAAALALKYNGIQGVQAGLAGLGGRIASPNDLVESRLIAAGQGLSAGATTSKSQFGNFAANNILGNNIPSALFQGIFAAAIPALQNFNNEDDKFGKLKAGADVIGGIAGGLIGSLTGAGPAIGAVIGVAVAEAFINKTIAYDTNIFGYNKEAGLGKSFRPDTSTDTDAALRVAEIKLYESIGHGNEAFGRFLAGLKNTDVAGADLATLNEKIENLAGATTPEEKLTAQSDIDAFLATGRSAAGGTGVVVQDILKNLLGITPELIQDAIRQGKPIEVGEHITAYNLASPEARAQYDAALAERTATDDQDISKYFTSEVGKNRELFGGLLDTLAAVFKERLSGQRVSGDVTGAQYARKTQAADAADTKALQFYTGFGEEFNNINDSVSRTGEVFNSLYDIIINGASESVNELTALNGEIAAIENALNDPALKNAATITIPGLGEITRGELQVKLVADKNLAAKLATDIQVEINLSRLEIPGIRGDITKPLAPEELDYVKTLAKQLEDLRYKDLSEADRAALQTTWEDWAQIIEKSGETFFEIVSGFDPETFQMAMQLAAEQNKLPSQEISPFGIEQIDLPGSQKDALQAQIDYFSKYLSDNFPEYQQKDEEFGVIFNDYVTDTLHGDNLAIKLALEKLIDINQKQLDGQYNIPEGATFWVPLTAAYYRNTGGGSSTLDATQLNSASSYLSGAADALYQSAYWLSEKFGYVIPDPATDPNSAYFKSEKHGETYVPPVIVEPDSEQHGERYGETPSTTPRIGGGPEVKKNTITSEGQSIDNPYPARRGGGTARKLESPASDFSSFTDSIRNVLASVLQTRSSNNTDKFPGIGFPVDKRSFINSGSAGQLNPAPVSRIDLKLSSTTNLQLDGRILASALQNYLASDLLRTEATQGTITKRYII